MKGRLSPAGGGRQDAGGRPRRSRLWTALLRAHPELGMCYSDGQLPLLSLACEISNIPEPLFRFSNSQKIPIVSPSLTTRSPTPLPPKMSYKMANNQIPLSLRILLV